jgi:hypothetical protein
MEEREILSRTDLNYIQGQVITPEEIAESRFMKAEIDMDAYNIDFDEREAQEELEENDEERNQELLGMVNDAFENHQKLTLENQEKAQIEQQTKEEKTDAQPVINVNVEQPDIKVESPTINNNIPESDKTLENEIKTRLDNIEKSKTATEIKELSAKIDETQKSIEKKIEDIDLEIDFE